MPTDLGSLRSQSIADLVQTARALNVENASSLRKPDLVAAILREKGGAASSDGDGVLEILPDGFGFLRVPEYSFLPGQDDIYVSPSQIRRFNLRTGDLVSGQVRAPKENERYFALIKVERVNGLDPEQARDKVLFENLTPIWPRRRLALGDDVACRLVGRVAPLGFGQRALVLGPPRAGRTSLLRALATGIAGNNRGVTVIVSLLAERPEEVTEFEREVPGTLLATTFDEPDTRHVQVADMVIERAKRLVEHRKDVVVLVDSLTRLARAAHATAAPGGRELAGGLEAGAVQRVRRLFGAARAVDEGGSLTVIAVLDADTGVAADAMLVAELRAAANCELRLDAAVAERRVYPALDVARSGTLREEVLLGADELAEARAFRRATGGSVEAALQGLDKATAAGE
ncbi:MAG: transcription termination factor Rho [Myxococcota bacterium]